MTRHVPVETLSAFVSGETAERDTAVIRTHLADCAACARVADELRVQATSLRVLGRPEPPPTLWSAIEGALDEPPRRFWSWRPLLTGAFVGAAVVMLALWGVSRGGGASALRAGAGGAAGDLTSDLVNDPMVAEAERALGDAASSYARAAARLRAILEREQVQWDPEARARVSERLVALDDAVAHSQAVARRDPADGAGAEMLFSAYRKQIDFLAEAVRRGAPAGRGGPADRREATDQDDWR